MLTKKFWELAEETKQLWTDEDYDPSSLWQKGYDYDRPIFKPQPTATHCGSYELSDVHSIDKKQGGTLERLVAVICYQLYQCSEGHAVYYCPKQKKYREGVKRLQSLGFEKAYDFVHHGFRLRKPDYGRAEAWKLAVTKVEGERIIKIGKTVTSWEEEEKELCGDFSSFRSGDGKPAFPF